MSYEHEGYTIARDIIPERQIGELNAAVTSLVARWRDGDEAVRDGTISIAELTADRPQRNPGISPETVAHEPFIIGDLLAHDRRFVDLLKLAPLWALAAQAIGVSPGRVVFHFSNLTRKPACVGPSIAWHRDMDNRYFLPSGPNFVRLLIPLADMSDGNGGTGVVPGSHAHDDQTIPATLRQGDLRDVVWPVLKAGDVLVTHPKVIHGGLPNRSDTDRDLLVLQFGVKDATLKEMAAMEAGSLLTLEEMRRNGPSPELVGQPSAGPGGEGDG